MATKINIRTLLEAGCHFGQGCFTATCFYHARAATSYRGARALVAHVRVGFGG